MTIVSLLQKEAMEHMPFVFCTKVIVKYLNVSSIFIASTATERSCVEAGILPAGSTAGESVMLRNSSRTSVKVAFCSALWVEL